MAEEEIELVPAAQSSSKLKLISLVLGGMMFAGGATVGGLYAAGMLGAGSAPGEESAPAESAPVAQDAAFYVPLSPSFTVNFDGVSAARFLRVSIEAMTRDPNVESDLQRHMPMIRNDLMVLFSAKNSATLGTREGKETLAAETLASIQGVLERETGNPGIEAVYFTSFVMQ